MLAWVLSSGCAALIAPWLARRFGHRAGWMLAVLPLLIVLHLGACIPRVAAGDVLRETYPWVPGLGINLSFVLDGLSLFFALLVCGIGALVLGYSGAYLAKHARLGRFFALLLAFMASMLGLVLAGDLLALVTFWELTSLSSFLLIGFEHESQSTRAAALQALLVTSAGGLALLVGVVLLALVGGSTESSVLASQSAHVRAHPLYPAIAILVFVGAFTKSAQVPFQFWLPGAMVAPTPVSAYLHSATMVKAGIYLLARLHPLLGGTALWYLVLTTTGLVTMLVGAWIAFCASDLKRVLAFATLSALGLLTALLGIGTPAAAAAALTYLLAHALYKGALFLVVGAIDHATGTRDIHHLGGLWRPMPATALAAGLAALSMAGAPPALGFVAKEMFYDAARTAGRGALALTSVMVASSALLVAIALLTGVRPFFGPRRGSPIRVHREEASLWFGPLVLALAGFTVGLVPGVLGRPLIEPAIAAVLGRSTRVHLARWHGFGKTFALSVATLVAGGTLYLFRGAIQRAVRALHLPALSGSRAYERVLDALRTAARVQTRILQSGLLRRYVLTVIGTTIALGTLALVSGAGWKLVALGVPRARFRDWVVAGMIVLAGIVAAFSRTRLGAVAAMGFVGYGIAFVYIGFGAPDLAMTQILVETLTVILFVLTFPHLPPFTRRSSLARRASDIAVALTFGAMMTTLILAAVAWPPSPRLKHYFATQSVPQAHGRNIVNVILVDFRALDTLGEIFVLTVAAIGVFGLIKLRRTAKRGP